MSLEFLNYLDGDINKEALQIIKKEREKWWSFPNNKHCGEVLKNLPKLEGKFSIKDGIINILSEDKLEDQKLANLKEQLLKLKNWKKGPFNLFGVEIDSEWKSDYKWDRIKNKIGSLEGKTVLDIGCNNGYYMFQMLEQNPKRVLGIDPSILFKTQFEVINHYARYSNLHFETFGVEHLEHFRETFDTVFSMGILYHHRDPISQLRTIRQSMKLGGELILETIGIPGDGEYSLTPKDRYACMPNIYFLPTLSALINWLEKVRFVDIEVISTEWGGVEEQRTTEWSTGNSLKNFLDPNDLTKTVEGYPAPMRFCLRARKKKVK
jgi:tRNA (mo5U34)-methyltransferase